MWRCRTSLHVTQKHRRALLSTTNSMLSVSSPTLAAQPCTITDNISLDTSVDKIPRLGRQLELSLVSRLECGQTPRYRLGYRPKCQSIMLVLPTHCFFFLRVPSRTMSRALFSNHACVSSSRSRRPLVPSGQRRPVDGTACTGGVVCRLFGTTVTTVDPGQTSEQHVCLKSTNTSMLPS